MKNSKLNKTDMFEKKYRYSLLVYNFWAISIIALMCYLWNKYTFGIEVASLYLGVICLFIIYLFIISLSQRFVVSPNYIKLDAKMFGWIIEWNEVQIVTLEHKHIIGKQIRIIGKDSVCPINRLIKNHNELLLDAYEQLLRNDVQMTKDAKMFFEELSNKTR